MMELRNQQARALVKSGMVSGRMEGDVLSLALNFKSVER